MKNCAFLGSDSDFRISLCFFPADSVTHYRVGAFCFLNITSLLLFASWLNYKIRFFGVDEITVFPKCSWQIEFICVITFLAHFVGVDRSSLLKIIAGFALVFGVRPGKA